MYRKSKGFYANRAVGGNCYRGAVDGNTITFTPKSPKASEGGCLSGKPQTMGINPGTIHGGLSGILPPTSYHCLSFLRGSPFGQPDPNEKSHELINPVGTKGILYCPMAVKSYRNDSIDRSFTAWEIERNGVTIRGSYGFNEWLFSGFFFSDSVRPDWRGLNIFSLSGRAGIPVLLDSAFPKGRPNDSVPPPYMEGGMNLPWPFCMNRHNGHVNGLFLDWSVRKVGLKELWTLKWRSEFDTAGPWTKAGGVQPEDWPEWMRRFKDY